MMKISQTKIDEICKVNYLREFKNSKKSEKLIKEVLIKLEMARSLILVTFFLILDDQNFTDSRNL